MCWLLKEDLGYSVESSDSVLYTTQFGTDFSPWIPPHGVPEGTLQKLRQILLQALNTEFDFL